MGDTLRVANDDPGAEWAAELVRRVGRAIKAGRNGKSAAWLSDRTAELGYRISPTVIAKLDSGHRGGVLSVAELVVLAAALNMSPVTLLYPGPYDEVVEVAPGRSAQKLDVVQWFSALHWLPNLVVCDDGETWETAAIEARADWESATKDVALWRHLADLTANLRDESTLGGEMTKSRQRIMEFYKREILNLRRQLGIADA